MFFQGHSSEVKLSNPNIPTSVMPIPTIPSSMMPTSFPKLQKSDCLPLHLQRRVDVDQLIYNRVPKCGSRMMQDFIHKLQKTSEYNFTSKSEIIHKHEYKMPQTKVTMSISKLANGDAGGHIH